MAAGRHGGFLENKDFRVREADIGVSRKRELHRDRNRDGDREKERDRRDHVDKVRIRTREAKRATMNGFHRLSSSSTSSSSGDSGNTRFDKRGHIVGGPVDREPGELSSGSGSDDPDDPQSKMVSNGVMDVKMEASTPPVYKRKFSPIVWDRDDVKRSSATPRKRETESVDGVSLPPPPPLPEGFVPLNSRETAILKEDTSPPNSYTIPEFQQDQKSNNRKEPGEVEEDEDYLPARNISASRWADDDDFSEDEESDAKRKRGTGAALPSASTVLNKKVPTPESGDGGTRENLDGAETGISGFGAEGNSEHEIDRNDHMDVDGVDVDKKFIDDESDVYISDEDIMTTTPAQSQPPQRNINMLQGCRSVDEFERLNKIDEGTYGVVYRAKDKKTGEIVALKKVKMEKETEGFPLTSLREINILLSFHHPSIVDVKEVVVGSSLDSIFMVMEYMEHNLKGLMESMKQRFSQSEVKCLMLQLLEGVKYLHDNWVLHRDLKTSNLLFNNRGELKICDFGLSRQYGSPLKRYTHLVVTLWYRSPELLLGAKEYSTAVDMWSLGCIMAELLAKEPLFNGKTEFDQLDKIFRVLGTPNGKIWPGFPKLPGVKAKFVKHPYNTLREKFPPTSFSGRPTLSEKGFDLLNKLLTYDPKKRISAEEALKHEWFTEVPLPKTKDFMPTFPAVHAQDRRLKRVMKSPDPLEEQRQRELRQGGIATGSLFN